MNAIALCKLDCSVESNLALIGQLALVTDQIYANVLCRMGLDLLEPFTQTCKCLVACDVIRQEHLVGSSVEDTSHRLERLLAGLSTQMFRNIFNSSKTRLTVSQI